MKIVLLKFVFSLLICYTSSAPQNPEINDQFDSNHTEHPPEVQKQPEAPRHTEVEKLTEIDNTVETNTVHDVLTETTLATVQVTIPPDTIKEITEKPLPITETQQSLITKLYKTITYPIIKFMKAPKVSIVLTNIGTCIVNGAMEIISFYFPAPLIPLIASAAGLVIPFEPVVMLREKMPVTSYRRAFKTAVKGFLGTFDRYKYEEDDPYMTARFNRRFMGSSKEVKEEVKGLND